MRKVLLNVAVSLDGLIEGPAGEYDWCFTDQDYGITDFLARTDSIFFGRKSYLLFLEFDKNAWPGHSRIVFSQSAKSMEGATVINNVTKEGIEEIKQTKGKDIWLYGGAELTSSFINLDLVDELHLSIHPIILGAGKPLFSNIEERKKWKLMESKSYDTGLVQVRYELAGDRLGE